MVNSNLFIHQKQSNLLNYSSYRKHKIWFFFFFFRKFCVNITLSKFRFFFYKNFERQEKKNLTERNPLKVELAKSMRWTRTASSPDESAASASNAIRIEDEKKR